MKAVILAGGEGTRLRPLTCNVPKPMVPILNRPFLEHMLSHLSGHGVEHAILTMWYLPDVIRSHFGHGEGLGLRLSYTLEEQPLGTAGAVKNVESELDGPFLVLNGDIFTDLDLGAMARFHRDSGAMVTIALTQVEDPSAFGVVDMDDRGRVSRFVEKPPPGEAPSNWINAGTYLIEPEALAHAPGGEHYMSSGACFPSCWRWARQSTAIARPPTGRTWERLPATPGFTGTCCPPTASPPVTTRAGCILPQSSAAPVLLGRGCAIGPDAEVHGPVVMGAGCRVGEGAVVRDAILWRDVEVGRGAELDACIVGDGVSVGDRRDGGRRVHRRRRRQNRQRQSHGARHGAVARRLHSAGRQSPSARGRRAAEQRRAWQSSSVPTAGEPSSPRTSRLRTCGSARRAS